MNQLSWLIYLADVANASEGWFVFFGWAFGLPTVALILIMMGTQLFAGHSTDEDGRPIDPDQVVETLKEKRAFMKAGSSMLGFTMTATIIFIVLSVAIPSRDTMYAIAASELGEKAMQTPLVGKMGQALDAWLDKQITPPKTETPST